MSLSRLLIPDVGAMTIFVICERKPSSGGYQPGKADTCRSTEGGDEVFDIYCTIGR
jgi:hypothetical protein